jgi:hypothetical protein
MHLERERERERESARARASERASERERETEREREREKERARHYITYKHAERGVAHPLFLSFLRYRSVTTPRRSRRKYILSEEIYSF